MVQLRDVLAWPLCRWNAQYWNHLCFFSQKRLQKERSSLNKSGKKRHAHGAEGNEGISGAPRGECSHVRGGPRDGDGAVHCYTPAGASGEDFARDHACYDSEGRCVGDEEEGSRCNV